jgi:cysteine-rich repeat protein
VQADATSVCGDGAVDPGESCDDGNRNTGDGCDASCHSEL